MDEHVIQRKPGAPEPSQRTMMILSFAGDGFMGRILFDDVNRFTYAGALIEQ